MIATEPRRLRRALTTAALSALAVSLSACTSHGTDTIYQPAVGVSERSSEVDVLNAMIVADEDGEGRFVAGLANQDQQEGDELTGVSGAAEDSTVEVELQGGPIELQPGGYTQIADLGASREGTQVIVSGDSVKLGYFVRLSLQFRNAQPVEVHVPVVEEGEDMGPFSTDDPVESPSQFPATAETEESE